MTSKQCSTFAKIRKKYHLLLVFIRPFVLTSCGDDKEKEEPSLLDQQLVGDWVNFQGSDNELEFHFIFNTELYRN